MTRLCARSALTTTGIARLVMGVVLACSSAGCAALVLGAAGGAAGAVYVMGKLQEELPYAVPTVHDTAVAGMGDLDLKPLENRTDKLSAHLESRFADDTRAWIDLESLEASRTRLTIRVGLTGDEVRSRRILDAIRRHLPSATP